MPRFRPPILSALLVLLAAAAPLSGCAGGSKRALTAEEFQANAKAAYEEANQSFDDRDWVAVALLMDDVKREFAGTRWARLAQLRIADAQFRQGEFAAAVTAYREFLRDFPSDKNVPYARYQVILCQFEGRGDAMLSPPLEERDLVNVVDASRSIDDFLRDYPAYPKRERILYMRAWVRGMLARHELYVARYYLGLDNFDAAVARTEYALATYKDTGLEAEALVLLGETHLKSGEHDQARSAFELVLSRFPKSPFVKPARNFIRRMDEQGQ